MRYLFLYLFLILMAPSAVFAIQVDKLFHIEMVFFKHRNPQHKNLESWRSAPLKNHLKLATSLNPPIEEASLVEYPCLTKLLPTSLSLDKLSVRLPKKRYEIIEHLGWRQMLTYNQMSPKIHITAGENFGVQSYGLLNAWEIEGVINLRRGRHLYSNIEFVWRQPIDYETSTPKETFALQSYRLQQSQRLKVRQWHYFDHPLFGVLLSIEEVKAS